MNPAVKKVSLEELTSRKQRDATTPSLESSKLLTLSEELNSLQRNRTNLIDLIRAANEVIFSVVSRIGVPACIVTFSDFSGRTG